MVSTRKKIPGYHGGSVQGVPSSGIPVGGQVAQAGKTWAKARRSKVAECFKGKLEGLSVERQLGRIGCYCLA